MTDEEFEKVWREIGDIVCHTPGCLNMATINSTNCIKHTYGSSLQIPVRLHKLKLECDQHKLNKRNVLKFNVI